MNPRIALAALALLAGCAMTPKEMLVEGERGTHTLKQPPALAAGCMARNFENYAAGFQATIRSLPEPDALEVITRWHPDFIAVIAHVRPEKEGRSHVTTWLRPHWFAFRDDIVPAMLKGC
jgi:hypothetical protein